MLNGHKFACVLAARAGSKRLKDKNLAMCAVKPLWQWTKEAVEAAGIFDIQICTTDIYDMAKHFHGEWSSVGRPWGLAGDDVHISDVVQWALVTLGICPKARPDYTCLVSPTNPLRTGKHIRDAAKLMLKEKADAVVSVAPCHPKGQNVQFSAQGHVIANCSDNIRLLTQHTRATYRLTGAIVIAKTELWAAKASIYNDPNIKTVGYVMPKWDIDIDTKDDLFMAEAMLQCLRKRRTSLKSSIKSAIQARSSKSKK